MNGIAFLLLALIVGIWLYPESDNRGSNYPINRRRRSFRNESIYYSIFKSMVGASTRFAMRIFPIILAFLQLPVQLLTLPYDSEYS